jgi:thiosulfate/3-mercaptopyruvate sulfurtransferase
MKQYLETETMKTDISIWLGTLLILATTISAADKDEVAKKPSEISILIEPAQLQKQLNDKNLRILDVRSQDDYSKGHVPGAVRVDVGGWKNLAIADNGLHDAKSWAAQLGSLGITSKSHVVVYGGRLTDTARIWWLLKYVGVKNASLLNGSWESWLESNRSAETSTPKIAATEFTPEFQADRLAEIDSVKKSLQSENVKVVDTRSDGEFASGRIPDSVHLEWKHLLAEDGRFKTPKQLKEIFRKQGILPVETAVCY